MAEQVHVREWSPTSILIVNFSVVEIRLMIVIRLSNLILSPNLILRYQCVNKFIPYMM
jgi:hypothetical protein